MGVHPRTAFSAQPAVREEVRAAARVEDVSVQQKQHVDVKDATTFTRDLATPYSRDGGSRHDETIVGVLARVHAQCGLDDVEAVGERHVVEGVLIVVAADLGRHDGRVVTTHLVRANVKKENK